jgi:hypothetical protein
MRMIKEEKGMSNMTPLFHQILESQSLNKIANIKSARSKNPRCSISWLLVVR